jgi:hypothetical protein
VDERELLSIPAMKPDSFLSEIRQARKAYAERFAGDIRAMLADLRRRQQESGRVTVKRPPKRLKQTPSRGIDDVQQ